MAQRLTGEQLLVLQLRAVGYSRAQIAAMTGSAEEAVRAALATCAAALGAPDEPAAVEEADHRGLLWQPPHRAVSGASR